MFMQIADFDRKDCEIHTVDGWSGLSKYKTVFVLCKFRQSLVTGQL